jgi:signal transduction histidine kinase
VKTTRKTVSLAHVENAARLRTQVRKLREQLRRAQSIATLGTMTAMVAHEFNNILTPIVNYAQLARNNPSLQAKAVSQAADSGKRASAICDAILGMARPGAKETEEIHLQSFVEETLTAMARDPHKDAIDLSVSVPEDLVLVARRPELQQVLLNLLLNARHAVKARPGPRRIEIRAQADGRETAFSVRDNGVGIPSKNLTRIFEPFFTTRPNGGSGLGLAFCQQVVRSQGGRILVRSRPGAGTTFTVVLPSRPLRAATQKAG